MGKDELISVLHGVNIANMSATDVSTMCDEICKVTGQTKPSNVGKKRLMIDNFYQDFKGLVGVDTSAPSSRGGGGGGGVGGGGGGPPVASGPPTLDASSLETTEQIIGEIAVRAAAGPISANDISQLSSAITKVTGSKPPGSLAQKRVFVDDFFVAKGGMHSATAQAALARAASAPHRAAAVASDGGGGGGIAGAGTHLAAPTGVPRMPDFDSPGHPTALPPAVPRGPPTRAELFALCHRAIKVGHGWVRADTEAKQLATAIYELTTMPVGPDPAQYVADWYNWMRWQTGAPAEPRAFRVRPKPRAALHEDMAAQQMLYAQQLQQQQLQQHMYQQHLYQQQQQQQHMFPHPLMPQPQQMANAMLGVGGAAGGGYTDPMHAQMLAQMHAQQLGGQNQMMGAMYGAQRR